MNSYLIAIADNRHPDEANELESNLADPDDTCHLCGLTLQPEDETERVDGYEAHSRCVNGEPK